MFLIIPVIQSNDRISQLICVLSLADAKRVTFLLTLRAYPWIWYRLLVECTILFLCFSKSTLQALNIPSRFHL